MVNPEEIPEVMTDQQFQGEMAALEIRQKLAIARAEMIADAISGALWLIGNRDSMATDSPEVDAALLQIIKSTTPVEAISEDTVSAHIDIYKPLQLALLASWRLANANVASCNKSADPSIDSDTATYI